ncbi:terminase large subunit [Micromonospora rosaria]|uniref:terminase large subunit n=1 Tax=Micromonospora rosaria TaxID=47874 RepID=UPI0012FA740F
MSSVLGRTEPRLWTPPLRPLTPETSVGFEQVEFARDVVRMPLDPWQEWLVVHAGELLPDGRPRFRVVLVLVSRQNGKTTVPKLLTLHWMYVDRWPMTLGVSSKLEYAREVWLASIDLAKASPELAPEILNVRTANGQEEFAISGGARAKIAAANGDAGRSLSIDRLYVDELRQHHTYTAWAAAESTMNARPHAQAWLLSNAGSDASVVLNDLREAALAGVDDRLGLFEWSADDDADPLDLDALAQANPNLGRRLSADTLLAAARRAVELGGEALTTFKTENMCIRVKVLNPAIDPGDWRDCCDPAPVETEQRLRLAGCVDLSPDGLHATLAVAVILEDGRARVEAVHEWTGPDAATQLERELPAWAQRVRPAVLGWYPGGPAAAVAAKLVDRRKEGVRGWPPRGVRVAEIRGETTAVCMGFAKEVKARTVAHSGQAMPGAQVAKAERLRRGDGWVFTRAGGQVDAVYAMAGAVHLARTMPRLRQVSRRTRGA